MRAAHGFWRIKVAMDPFEDPNDIADFLIEEEGLDRALETTFDGIARAHARRDYYLLSVWREVRAILRHRMETVREPERD
jgi:hypothetical protein